MNAETRTLQQVFHGDRRLIVPVYQRPYVWEQDRQWEPLWSDVEATATRLAEARVEGHHKGLDVAKADQSASPHFLGALVIEQSPTATGDIENRLIVDGQQRLITLQLLLRGVLDALQECNAPKPIQARIRKAIRNDPEVVEQGEILKVAPRPAERDEFGMAMSDEAPEPHMSKFAAARDFFGTEARDFLGDEEVPEDPYGDGSSHDKRASLLAATLLGLVKLVVIDLEDMDDAQVIFEALNARNTPLSATDLVKNLLFMRARAQHDDPQSLYDSLWSRFDDDRDWWLEPVGVGHAQRARQDWLLGDWLIAQRGRVISIGRLYGEFRRWLDETGTKPREALQTLNEYADAYEVLSGRRDGASAQERVAFQQLDRLNLTVANPLLLWLLVRPPEALDSDERELAIVAIASFVLRRMAAKLQTRAYGQVFAEVLKAAHDVSHNPGHAVIRCLREKPHGYAWPTDPEISSQFAEARYYGPGGIGQGRLKMLLGAIDDNLQRAEPKAEPVTIDYDGLQVEHVIPQTWKTYWPVLSEDPNEQVVLEQARESHLNRIGNLTLVTGSLNVAMSNDPWATKNAELAKHSKLCLNAKLIEHLTWTEEDIVARGRWLAAQLGDIWPGPDSDRWPETTMPTLPIESEEGEGDPIEDASKTESKEVASSRVDGLEEIRRVWAGRAHVGSLAAAEKLLELCGEGTPWSTSRYVAFHAVGTTVFCNIRQTSPHSMVDLRVPDASRAVWCARAEKVGLKAWPRTTRGIIRLKLTTEEIERESEFLKELVRANA